MTETQRNERQRQRCQPGREIVFRNINAGASDGLHGDDRDDRRDRAPHGPLQTLADDGLPIFKKTPNQKRRTGRNAADKMIKENAVYEAEKIVAIDKVSDRG